MFLPSHPPRLPTIGRVAEELGEPIHRVAYAVRSRNISPSATAGQLRLYDKSATNLIKLALADMSKSKSKNQFKSKESIHVV